MCKFSLTSDGQTYFDGLNTVERDMFLGNISSQLASIIPINTDRIGPISYFKDSLYTVELRSTKNPKEKSSESIRTDLNTLIKNGNVTLISWFNGTKYIDYTYGFIVSGKHSYFLILLILSFFINIFLYFNKFNYCIL